VNITGGNGIANGGGIVISGSSVTLDSCSITNNSAVVSGYGGGIYSTASTLTLTNCLIKNNVLSCGNYQSAYGGGIAIGGGQLTMARTVITRNTVGGSAASYSAPGGGLYMGAGTTGVINNCLFTFNDATIADVGQYVGDGLYIGGKASILNCTIAGNMGQGIYNVGTVGLTNSILWNNGDDLTGTVSVAYSLIQTADAFWTNLINGCVLGTDPLFGDTTNCHLKSRAGFYTNGYFSGGGWSTNSNVTNNPAIDVGATNSLWASEPQPSGHRINLGAYGNTPVASKTFLEEPGVFNELTVYAYPPADVGPSSGTLGGEVLNDGGQGAPAAYICWDERGDQGTESTSSWLHIIDMGSQPMWQVFSTNLTSLAGNTFYRCYVTNGAGADWSGLQNFGTAELPGVTNNGAFPVFRRTATLRGEVTATGGDDPTVWFYYWVAGAATTNIFAVPGQPTGPFNALVSGLLAGSNYQYQALASNAAGAVWSSVSNFTTVASSITWYVSTNGTGLYGTNWSGAFPTVSAALDISENGDSIYLAGQSFGISNQVNWLSRTNMIVRGAYQAASDANLPGPNDPNLWPTSLRRSSGTTRVMFINSVSNGTLEKVTLTGGNYATQPNLGSGLYIANSSLKVDTCAITNNASYNSMYDDLYGGGILCNNSTVLFTNCLIKNNSVICGAYSSTYGGGLCAIGGSHLTLIQSVVVSNRSFNNGGSGYGTAGGGICILGNSVLWARNTLISRNDSLGVIAGNNSGDGLYVGGTAIVVNCTVADNLGEGIRNGGAVFATNSIFWGNGDDLTGTVHVAYCDIQTADSFWTNEVDGCMSVDPLFVDTTYYHLQSRAGQYVGGYFSGGSWSASLTNDSPCIDAGDRASPYNNEPSPNGSRVNLGAYGNTVVASMRYMQRGTIFTVN